MVGLDWAKREVMRLLGDKLMTDIHETQLPSELQERVKALAEMKLEMESTKKEASRLRYKLALEYPLYIAFDIFIIFLGIIFRTPQISIIGIILIAIFVWLFRSRKRELSSLESQLAELRESFNTKLNELADDIRTLVLSPANSNPP